MWVGVRLTRILFCFSAVIDEWTYFLKKAHLVCLEI